MSGQLSDIGVAGLCPAGRALALRLAAMGWRISVWDPSAGSAEAFVTSQGGTRGGLVGYADCQDFVESLQAPPRIAIFGAQTSPAMTLLRLLLPATDHMLDYPLQDEVSSCDLDLLELTLVFQMA